MDLVLIGSMKTGSNIIPANGQDVHMILDSEFIDSEVVLFSLSTNNYNDWKINKTKDTTDGIFAKAV